MAAHAKLSASGSKRWLSCSASVQAEQGYEDQGNVYADEGTAAHTLAERCLTYAKPASFFIGETIKGGSHVFKVDEDMAAAVQVYVDYCNNLSAEIRLLEKKVRFDKWVPDGFGTSDFIAVESDKEHGRRIIHVVDLKYGKGVMVDALNNSQAMLYGLGVIQTFKFIYGFTENDLVNCTIVQPRLDHISEFSISVGDLLRWADKVVVPAVKDALGDNPTYTPGEDQCRWCKAKGDCKALADFMFKTVAEDFTVIGDPVKLKDRSKLTPQDIGVIMQILPMMYEWGKSVEAQGFNLKMKGTHIPGFKLVKGKAKNKAWTEDEETIKVELNALDLEEDDYTKTTLLTPTQVLKLLKKKKIDEKKIALFWSQAEGDITIAPESDRRDEVEPPTSVEKDFTAIN